MLIISYNNINDLIENNPEQRLLWNEAIPLDPKTADFTGFNGTLNEYLKVLYGYLKWDKTLKIKFEYDKADLLTGTVLNTEEKK